MTCVDGAGIEMLVINIDCEKCQTLDELYCRTPKSDRDYWLMTELFVMLHGGDVCRG